jgi:RNA polymerase sigma-70 factor, ECF subfamily
MSELYATHRRAAVRVVQRIVRDEDEAEDVVQDVFVRLHAQGVRFDGRAAYGTWLHRVLVNSSINALRARSRRGRLESSLTSSLDPEEAAAQSEARARLQAALERLSEQHRQVVTLRDVRGYAYPRIALLLRIPEGTVKSALNRGRARLMKLLEAAESAPPAGAPAHSDLSPMN